MPLINAAENLGSLFGRLKAPKYPPPIAIETEMSPTVVESLTRMYELGKGDASQYPDVKLCEFAKGAIPMIQSSYPNSSIGPEPIFNAYIKGAKEGGAFKSCSEFKSCCALNSRGGSRKNKSRKNKSRKNKSRKARKNNRR